MRLRARMLVPFLVGALGLAAFASIPAPGEVTGASDERTGARQASGTIEERPGEGHEAPTGAVLDRVVVCGASLSAGFWIARTDFADVVGSLRAPNAEAVRRAPVLGLGDSTFFTDPIGVATGQIERALRADPTLVVAIDFLFWFGYGHRNAEMRPIGGEEERLGLLQLGLDLLDRFDCPIVVADYPDMSDTIGLMMTEVQVPSRASLAALNARVKAWAAERGDVLVLPLADVHGRMRAGESFTIGRYAWPAGATKRLLKPDQLHPTTEGLLAVGHLLALELIEHDVVEASALRLDLPELMAEYDVDAEILSLPR